MSQSIYDVAKSKPDVWIRMSNCTTENQECDLGETGGMLRWCTCCNCYGSPNRPCFCGCMVLQREDGLFWGGEYHWVDDWRIHAEHYFSIESASQVASALSADNGLISVYLIHTDWKKAKPEVIVR
ncbi:hypothetical protein LCGC14_1249680 [marine sediment metagenome]|uniref:Uncharacterized protein n=1 Tax=marine sediment metagenome TaxID=412755 RepID=A0A0F9L3C5_9ZZZZ